MCPLSGFLKNLYFINFFVLTFFLSMSCLVYKIIRDIHEGTVILAIEDRLCIECRGIEIIQNWARILALHFTCPLSLGGISGHMSIYLRLKREVD